ncbi:MAG: carbohydrate ABC transporter permease [Desulfobacterales bacterium]|nr:MAG: carbohydrate ABC transporter permease [Desulfobacterales bacterium]
MKWESARKNVGRPRAGTIQWLGLHYAVLIVLSGFCLAPVIIMLQTSFKVETQIFSDPPVWFFVPTIQNYIEVLQADRFGRYLTNSLIVGLVSTLLTLGFGGMAAYAMVRFRFMGKGVVSLTTLLLRMIPPAVLAVPVFVIWSDWGLLNQRNGLILVYVAMNLPFTIWILYGFIAQIPVTLEEAAVIDGCNAFQVYLRVVLPLIRPGLAAAAIFTFRIAWNEFILALVLTNRFTRTLPVATSLFLTDHGIQWGKIMAMGTLIALPPLIFTFVAAKQIITGLTAGAVKG